MSRVATIFWTWRLAALPDPQTDDHPYTSIAEQERAERQGILDHFSVRWEQLEGV